jgi:hypothetical protein
LVWKKENRRKKKSEIRERSRWFVWFVWLFWLAA